MHVWGSPQCFDGHPCEHGHDRSACSQHHGLQADGERHAFWRLPVHGQSHGGRCYRRRHGGPGAHALHSHDHGTLGARCANSFTGQHARPQQQCQVDVHVGRRDFHQCAWPIHGHGALITEKDTE